MLNQYKWSYMREGGGWYFIFLHTELLFETMVFFTLNKKVFRNYLPGFFEILTFFGVNLGPIQQLNLRLEGTFRPHRPLINLSSFEFVEFCGIFNFSWIFRKHSVVQKSTKKQYHAHVCKWSYRCSNICVFTSINDAMDYRRCLFTLLIWDNAHYNICIIIVSDNNKAYYLRFYLISNNNNHE